MNIARCSFAARGGALEIRASQCTPCAAGPDPEAMNIARADSLRAAARWSSGPASAHLARLDRILKRRPTPGEDSLCAGAPLWTGPARTKRARLDRRSDVHRAGQEWLHTL